MTESNRLRLTVLSLAITAAAITSAALSGPDFDGDGPDDLAIGVPGETLAGLTQAGGVAVLYGSSGGGLAVAGDQFWQQGSPGIGTNGAGNAWGSAMAWGDFDNDGFDDIAVGIPGNDVGGEADAGAVHVIYGSATGLKAEGDQRWTAASNNILGDPESEGRFGSSLAAGDFNGDNFDDLAIGEPGADVGVDNKAGAVHVLYGSANGLRALNNQLWTQDSPNIADSAELDDRFGHALAAGDFNGDGRDDLAVGVPFEDFEDLVDAGVVQIIRGSASGLTGVGGQRWSQNSEGIAETAASKDRFGWCLAVGDFDGDSRDDLAIGVPLEDIGVVPNAGGVHALYGSASGLTASDDEFWSQNTNNIAETAEAGDRFGTAMAAGDFDGDSRDDLAIGAPFEDLGAASNAGVIHAIYGAPAGLATLGNQLWSQNSTGIPDGAENNDTFGASLSVSNFDNDAADDLVIGVPHERIGAASDAGAVHIIYGAPAGLLSVGDQFFNQDTPDVANVAEAGDIFGQSLAGNPYAYSGAGFFGKPQPWLAAVTSVMAIGLIGLQFLGQRRV